MYLYVAASVLLFSILWRFSRAAEIYCEVWRKGLWNVIRYVRCELLMAVSIKKMIFWGMMPCRFVDGYPYTKPHAITFQNNVIFWICFIQSLKTRGIAVDKVAFLWNCPRFLAYFYRWYNAGSFIPHKSRKILCTYNSVYSSEYFLNVRV